MNDRALWCQSDRHYRTSSYIVHSENPLTLKTFGNFLQNRDGEAEFEVGDHALHNLVEEEASLAELRSPLEARKNPCHKSHTRLYSTKNFPLTSSRQEPVLDLEWKDEQGREV